MWWHERSLNERGERAFYYSERGKKGIHVLRREGDGSGSSLERKGEPALARWLPGEGEGRSNLQVLDKGEKRVRRLHACLEKGKKQIGKS